MPYSVDDDTFERTQLDGWQNSFPTFLESAQELWHIFRMVWAPIWRPSRRPGSNPLSLFCDSSHSVKLKHDPCSFIAKEKKNIPFNFL